MGSKVCRSFIFDAAYVRGCWDRWAFGGEVLYGVRGLGGEGLRCGCKFGFGGIC